METDRNEPEEGSIVLWGHMPDSELPPLSTERVRAFPKMARLVVMGFISLMVGGNVMILALTVVTKVLTPSASALPSPTGIKNLVGVDDRVLRGANPTRAGYRSLAAIGVTTVIDLRAEPEASDDDSFIEKLGLRVVHLPIRDGQVPSAAQVEEMLSEVAKAKGVVFLHCGAGVGRTGAMAGAYLVRTGQASASAALRRNLAVGPPSLEQISFVAGLDKNAERPAPAIVALSRMLDAPRRLWSRYGL